MTHKFCVIGNPVEHSRSPEIFELFSKQTKIKLIYDKIRSENFGQDIIKLVKKSFNGINVTIPFKEEACRICDILKNEAAKSMSVNTLHYKDAQIHGYTTDGIGLMRNLENNGIDINGKNVLLLGLGGAGRSIAVSLMEKCNVTIVNRTKSKIEEFYENLGIDKKSYSFLEINDTYDIIINATPLSIYGKVPEINPSSVNDAICYDLFYSKDQTSFNKYCSENGAVKTFDGLGMLVEQAAESFKIWTGQEVLTKGVIEEMKDKL